MRIEDMVLVSVDDHVVEPPNLFEGRLPAKYKDLAPQFITNEDGTNAWRYESTEVGNVALNAVAGRPKNEYGIEPTSFADIRSGCYDTTERIKDMDANGVLGSLCFPSFPQFCGQLFARTKDKDVALAMIRRTTTGTSTSGVARSPVGSSRWHCRPSGIRRSWPPRCDGRQPRVRTR